MHTLKFKLQPSNFHWNNNNKKLSRDYSKNHEVVCGYPLYDGLTCSDYYKNQEMRYSLCAYGEWRHSKWRRKCRRSTRKSQERLPLKPQGTQYYELRSSFIACPILTEPIFCKNCQFWQRIGGIDSKQLLLVKMTWKDEQFVQKQLAVLVRQNQGVLYLHTSRLAGRSIVFKPTTRAQLTGLAQTKYLLSSCVAELRQVAQIKHRKKLHREEKVIIAV